MNVSRESLDGYLLKKAVGSGAILIEERVTGVEKANDSWLVRTGSGEYHAKLLVGADGVNSVVRGTVAGRIPKENMAACIGYYVRGVERDYSVLKFFKDFKGYAWIFPRETYSSVGVGLDIKRAKQLPEYLNRFMEDYCPGVEKISPFGALVPAAREPDFYKAPCSGEDWVLIGDAAGHVDPVLGEGIRYALWDAELAAGAIVRGTPAEFDALWRKAYYRDFVEACKLRDFIYDSGMLERGVSLISRSGTFAHIMMGVIAGTQSYRDLRKTVIASLPKILSEVK
jgi:flavin-dependent dehydrogenase